MAAIVTQQLAGATVFARKVSASRPRTVPRATGPVAVSASADRPLWFPGNAAPAHLDGTLPGDFGFDPLKLGADKEDLKWMVQAELMHARWAMIGVAGMAAPELLSKVGAADLPVWYEAGKAEYFAPASVLIATQMFMMNWAEVRRWQDMKNPGSVNQDPSPFSNASCTGTEVGYPGGGLFDPFGFAKGDASKLRELQVKEIKNGRLAMLAAFGCMVQYNYTGNGPLTDLGNHLADPYHNNFFQEGLGLF